MWTDKLRRKMRKHGERYTDRLHIGSCGDDARRRRQYSRHKTATPGAGQRNLRGSAGVGMGLTNQSVRLGQGQLKIVTSKRHFQVLTACPKQLIGHDRSNNTRPKMVSTIGLSDINKRTKFRPFDQPLP